MKKITSILLFTLCLSPLSNIIAQESKKTTKNTATQQDETQKQIFDSEQMNARTLKKERRNHYSQWTLGVDIGLPFLFGDLRSFASDDTYIGGMAGLYLGYQINPTFGLMLSGSYGHNRAGSPSHSNSYILGNDAMTYYPPTTIPGTTYSELYSNRP